MTLPSPTSGPEQTSTIISVPPLDPSFATGTEEEIFLRILREKVPEYFSSSMVCDNGTPSFALATSCQNLVADRIQATSVFTLCTEDGEMLKKILRDHTGEKPGYKTLNQVLDQIRGVEIATTLIPYAEVRIVEEKAANGTRESDSFPVQLEDGRSIEVMDERLFPFLHDVFSCAPRSNIERPTSNVAYQIVFAAFLKGKSVQDVTYDGIRIKRNVANLWYPLELAVANPTVSRICKASRCLRQVLEVMEKNELYDSFLEAAKLVIEAWGHKAFVEVAFADGNPAYFDNRKLYLNKASQCFQKADEIIATMKLPSPEIRQYLIGARINGS